MPQEWLDEIFYKEDKFSKDEAEARLRESMNKFEDLAAGISGGQQLDTPNVGNFTDETFQLFCNFIAPTFGIWANKGWRPKDQEKGRLRKTYLKQRRKL